MAINSPGEELLAFQIRASGLPQPEREVCVIPNRKFRFDFAWTDPAYRLLVEVQGGVFKRGGHSTGVGITRDAEKLALATLAGYRVFFVTTNQVREGKAIQWIQEALANRP